MAINSLRPLFHYGKLFLCGNCSQYFQNKGHSHLYVSCVKTSRPTKPCLYMCAKAILVPARRLRFCVHVRKLRHSVKLIIYIATSASLVPSRPSFFSLPVRKRGTPGNTSHVRDVRFNDGGMGTRVTANNKLPTRTNGHFICMMSF